MHGPLDVKKIRKQKQSISASQHAVIITGKRVTIHFLSRGIDWKKLADVKCERVGKVSVGQAQSLGNKFCVQLVQKNGKAQTVWCKNKLEAESLRSRLLFHLSR